MEEQQYEPLGINDVWPIRPYAGQRVRDLIGSNPKYLLALEGSKVVRLTDEVKHKCYGANKAQGNLFK